MATVNPTGNLRIDVPPEVKNKPMQPGEVALRSIERVNGIFMVNFAWCDMLGQVHEKSFERGDIYTNFPKVLKAMTDYGLPFDPTKTEEFHQNLCKLSTFAVRPNNQPETETKETKQ